jgi:thiamine kinase-like enzyme
MDNMVRVTEHLTGLGVRTLELVSLRQDPSEYHYLSPIDQTYWRVFQYIPKCKSCLDHSSLSCHDVNKTAKAFGDFQYQLHSLPVDHMKETIPNFHNTRFRYECFLSALERDAFDLLKEDGVREDANFLLSRENKYVDVLLDLHDDSKGNTVPLRIVHNDTKISNVLLSEDTGDALCVIDLDTVMPGRSLYDFADIVRSACSSCGEEEADFSKVHLRLDMFQAAAEGYLTSDICVGADISGRLWRVEVEHLCVAGQVQCNNAWLIIHCSVLSDISACVSLLT